jgi:hypothetical protein
MRQLERQGQGARGWKATELLCRLFAGRHRGGKSVLEVTWAAWDTTVLFIKTDQQDTSYHHGPKALSITSCPMAFPGPRLVGTGGGPLAKLEGPINMLKPSYT